MAYIRKRISSELQTVLSLTLVLDLLSQELALYDWCAHTHVCQSVYIFEKLYSPRTVDNKVKREVEHH